tara:strand:+ start:1806 stop:2024 length:219 start_codon:yes stop_codon:yes gene_type:complete
MVFLVIRMDLAGRERSLSRLLWNLSEKKQMQRPYKQSLERSDGILFSLDLHLENEIDRIKMRMWCTISTSDH